MRSSRYKNWEQYEKYEALAEEFYERGRARRAHRAKKHRADHAAKLSRQEIVESLADETEALFSFQPTYLQNFDPKHHEYRWVLESLGGFYQDKLIADVLRIVKAGKEANVYACTGTEAAGHGLIAAKLYRPRMLRHLRNDAIYKEGRFVRDQAGKEMRGSREVRAMRKKTRFGQEIDFATWIGHEFQMQQMLHRAGADVPEPLAQRANTILMAYIGDHHQPAPTLIDTTLTAAEAPVLFERIMQNVTLMLAHNYVHGDLSAYNVLYWDGRITIIDFPQLADARVNLNAFRLLERDVRRVCDYFAGYGVAADATQLAAGLWDDYMHARL